MQMDVNGGEPIRPRRIASTRDRRSSAVSSCQHGKLTTQEAPGMRTLLTGFGSFGNVVNNPSARIVEHFARTGAPGHELTARVLPVSFARAGEAIRDLL